MDRNRTFKKLSLKCRLTIVIAASSLFVSFFSSLIILQAGLDTFGEIIKNITILIALVVLLSFVIAQWMQKFISEPIRKLLDAANQTASDKDYSRRIQSSQHDEIGSLYDGFNHFLSVIEKTQDDLLRQKYALDHAAIVSATDVDGNINYVSDSFCQLSGYSREELIGENNELLDADKHSVEFLRDLEQTIESGNIWHGELANRAKNGDIFWLASTIVPFKDRDGQIYQYLAIQFNITARKEVEEDLDHARRHADQANKAKSEFLSSMSHELRTPLNAILGFAQLLGFDDLSDEQRENVDEIEKAGNHLLQLINEVLDLAKIEAGRIDLNMEKVDLDELIDSCLVLTMPLAEKNNIQIDYASKCEVQVRADYLRLKQVLINLMSNAIKYNRPEGKVSISCIEPNDRKIRINISDTGYGIEDDKLEDLFVPFNRLDAESSEIEGTGIGLVITRRLMIMMGGMVGVESTVGEGSCFWVEIDRVTHEIEDDLEEDELALQQAIEDELEEISEEIDRSQTILYVEDNAANMRLVERVIEKQTDSRLLQATNAIEGIEMAKLEQPGLILMDINLPEMNGYQALEILLADPQTKHIPVVAISADAMPSSVEAGLNAGFTEYLTKPLDVKRFLEVIEEFQLKS